MPLVLENDLKGSFGNLSSDSNYVDKNLNYKRKPPRGEGGRNCTWALLEERNDDLRCIPRAPSDCR